MDPIDLRFKNAAGEGTVAPYGPRSPAIGLRACLEAAKEHPNYKAPVPEGAGRGLAVGFWFNIGMQSSAEVRIAEDGAGTVMEGSPDIGGSRASMALMAAETLGVPYEKVKAHVGDTESTGFCNVTGGSRTTFATGMAVIQACEDIIAQCRQRAALNWDLDEDQVDWVDGDSIGDTHHLESAIDGGDAVGQPAAPVALSWAMHARTPEVQVPRPPATLSGPSFGDGVRSAWRPPGAVRVPRTPVTSPRSPCAGFPGTMDSSIRSRHYVGYGRTSPRSAAIRTA